MNISELSHAKLPLFVLFLCVTQTLVSSTKLWYYYINGFSEGKSTHKARIHLLSVSQSKSAPPAVHSAPLLMDLLNTDNINPSEVNTSAIEEQLFNHPDPYNLDETDSMRVNVSLQLSFQTAVRSRVRFDDIASYVKLDDPILLRDLISKDDSDRPGALMTTTTQQGKAAKLIGKPGEWSVDNLL